MNPPCIFTVSFMHQRNLILDRWFSRVNDNPRDKGKVASSAVTGQLLL